MILLPRMFNCILRYRQVNHFRPLKLVYKCTSTVCCISTTIEPIQFQLNLPKTRVLRHLSAFRISFAAGYLSVNRCILASEVTFSMNRITVPRCLFLQSFLGGENRIWPNSPDLNICYMWAIYFFFKQKRLIWCQRKQRKRIRRKIINKKNDTDNDNDKNINYCDDNSNGIIWIEKKPRRMSL